MIKELEGIDLYISLGQAEELSTRIQEYKYYNMSHVQANESYCVRVELSQESKAVREEVIGNQRESSTSMTREESC